MSSAIIANARIRPRSAAAFTAWQVKHLAALSRFPGFVSRDMVPVAMGKSGEGWSLILNFDSEASVAAWQKAPERRALLEELAPLLEGDDFTETVSSNAAASSSEVTEVIFSKVRPGMEDLYREWAARIQHAQAAYPGYRGMYLQPPVGGRDGHWTSILRYDSAASLEAWMNAPERKALLEEAKEFIQSEELMRLGTAFPGWVPVDPVTGAGPPNWKTALLVLLGLFPIVMLEMKFLSPVFSSLGLHASLATFFGNVVSVAVTSFLTMPLFVNWFGWWLFPRGNAAAITTRGVGLLGALFAIEVAVLWNLLPW